MTECATQTEDAERLAGIHANVVEICEMEPEDITADDAAGLSANVFAILEAVHALRPLTLNLGSTAIVKLVNNRAGDDQTFKTTAEVVRLIGRMEGEYRGRFGRRGRQA